MTTLIIATGNPHKVAEIRAILSHQFRYLTLRDLPDAPAVVEDAHSFAGNATKKATAIARWFLEMASGAWLTATSDGYVLADDSGLEVDALGGAPGVLSARFAARDAESNSPDSSNNAKLLRLLKEVPLEQRTARFRCVMAMTPLSAYGGGCTSPVYYADPAEFLTETFEGVCEGRIAIAPAGAGGFGYDPLFIPEGCEQSFAELGEDHKNRLSHRAKALEKLKARLKEVRQE